MIKVSGTRACDESSDRDGTADHREICRLIDSALIQPWSCCSSKDAKRSARSRHKVWEEGECVDISPSKSWT